MKTRDKLLLLGSLYLSQGLPYGFLTQAVPVLLRQEGASLTTIGDTSILMLPWLLKFLWAPLVDATGSSRFGRRRSWIVPLQVLTALTLGALAFSRAESVLPVLLGATFVTALLASTQDVATDGLAVALLDRSERGLGNGVQVAGYRLGMVIGGGLLLVVFARIGWGASFGTMAVLLVLATLPILRHREAPSEPTPVGESVRALLRRPGMPAWLGILVAYKVGEQLGGTATKPMLVDLGLDLEAIGWLSAGDSATSLLGALVGGWFAGRMDRLRALVGFGLLQAVGVLAWAAPALGWVGLPGLVVVKLGEGFVGSMATAALFTAMMDACRERSGGTDYTVQASVVVFAAFLGSVLGGRMADFAIRASGSGGPGYALHFSVAAFLTALGALAVKLADPVLLSEE